MQAAIIKSSRWIKFNKYPQSSEIFPGRFILRDETSVRLFPNREEYLKVKLGKIPDSTEECVYEFQDAASFLTADVRVEIGEVVRVGRICNLGG